MAPSGNGNSGSAGQQRAVRRQQLSSSLFSESRRLGSPGTLATLRRVDPAIQEIVGSAPLATLYNFGNEWERADIEGPLFVCRRPNDFSLVVLNRLNLNNFSESILALEFEVVDRYMLFRNIDGTIRAFWLHSLEELHAISDLITKLQSENPEGESEQLPGQQPLLTPQSTVDQRHQHSDERLMTTTPEELDTLRSLMLGLIQDDNFLLEFHRKYRARLDMLAGPNDDTASTRR